MREKLAKYLLAAAVVCSPIPFSTVIYAQQSPENSLPPSESGEQQLPTENSSQSSEKQPPSEAPSCTETICSFPQYLCTPEQESQITSLQLHVFFS